MMEYKGIEIVRSGNKAKLRHSIITERNHNADYYEMMGYIPLYNPKSWRLDAEGNMRFYNTDCTWYFNEISKLYSVASRNYQICNGGISQYFFNGYQESRDPHEPGDSKHFGKGTQINFISGKLREFAEVVLTPEEFADYEQYIKISKLSSKTWEWDIKKMFPNVEFGRYMGAWDTVYYKYNGVFEQVVELYAQYIVKRYCKENIWQGFQVMMQSHLDNIRVAKYRRRHPNEDFRYVDVAEKFGAMFA